MWRDVLSERSDPDVALRRKLEALLGADPDDGDAGTIEQLVRDAEDLGKDSIGELAADHRRGGAIMGADALRQSARSMGFDASRDIARLAPGAARLPAMSVDPTCPSCWTKVRTAVAWCCVPSGARGGGSSLRDCLEIDS